jgi:regulatory protein
VEIKGAAGETIRVRLSDGSLFLIHAEVYVREGIAVGAELAPARSAELAARSQRLFARTRALALVSRAAQTRRGLTAKLRARGFEQDAVSYAVSRVAEMGYLDDRSFAERWIESRLAGHAEGYRALFRGLVRRGVDRALAEEVLAERCSWEVELASARQLTERLAAQAAVRKLTNRGFRSRTIGRVLREKKAATG